jgi:hypothetical protein
MKKLLKIGLIAALVFVLIINFTAKQAAAFAIGDTLFVPALTTVDRCAANPTCAAALGSEISVKAAGAASAASVGGFVVGAAGGAAISYGLSNLSQMRDKLLENYCADPQNCNVYQVSVQFANADCSPSSTVVFYSPNEITVGGPNTKGCHQNSNFIAKTISPPNLYYVSVNSLVNYTWVLGTNTKTISFPSLDKAPLAYQKEIIQPQIVNDPSVYNEYLTNEERRTYLQESSSVNLDLPTTLPAIVEDRGYIVTGVNNKGEITHISTTSTPKPDTLRYAPPGLLLKPPAISQDDSPSEGLESPAETKPVQTPNPRYTPNPDTTEEPKAPVYPDDLELELEPEDEPESHDLKVPQTDKLKGQEFEEINWVSYAVEKFGDKFPFDIIGNQTIIGNNSCPYYTFFNANIELCPLKTAINAIKIPIIIGLVFTFYWRI